MAFAAVLLGAPAASAKPGREARMRLAYARTHAAGACADEAGMRDAVAGRLGYDAFTGDAAGRVAISLDKRGADWQARIELDDGAGNKGVRALSSREASCDDLVSAVSLAVALAIDPERVTAPAPEGSKEPPAASAGPEPPRDTGSRETTSRETTPREPAPPPREGARATIFGSAGGFVHAGVVPSVSLGPRLRAGVLWPKASIAIEGLYVAPASETASAGRVQASIFGGGLVPCLRVPATTAGADGVGFDVCARALFGALFGETSSAAISTPTTVPWAAVGLELGLELPLGSVVRLRVHGGVLAAMTRTFLRIRDQGVEVDVYRSPVFSGGGGIDAVVLFP